MRMLKGPRIGRSVTSASRGTVWLRSGVIRTWATSKPARTTVRQFPRAESRAKVSTRPTSPGEHRPDSGSRSASLSAPRLAGGLSCATELARTHPRQRVPWPTREQWTLTFRRAMEESVVVPDDRLPGTSELTMVRYRCEECGTSATGTAATPPTCPCCQEPMTTLAERPRPSA